MKLLHTKKLNQNQKDQISRLSKDCRSAEPVTISIPADEDGYFYLLYEGSELCAVLSLFFPDLDTCECTAFTHPTHRRRGLFTALLEEAMEDIGQLEDKLNTEIVFCFTVDGYSLDATATLNSLEAELWYSEYMMEKAVNFSVPPEKLIFSSPLLPDTNTKCECFFKNQPDHVHCRLISQGNAAYLYGLEVQSNLRRQGLGERFINCLIPSLASFGFTRICLQVSSQNEAALALYKKTGFQICQTLSYYLY